MEPEDEALARRFFWGGCCGLPWLWAVNVLYFLPLIRQQVVSPGAKRC